MKNETFSFYLVARNENPFASRLGVTRMMGYARPIARLWPPLAIAQEDRYRK